MAAPLKPAVTCVLRIGLDGLAVAAVDRELQVRAQRQAPSAPLADAPYPALDHQHVWRWALAALEDLGERFRIDTIVPTAFGGTVALVDERGLVLPLMHPEAEPPAYLREAFAAAAPSADAVGMRTPPCGVSTGLQLFWQKRASPQAFERGRWVLSHAAYWGWRLTAGGLATEASSLAEGGQLIELASCRPSTLSRREGFQMRLASLREPHRLLGRLAQPLAARTGLSAETRVLVGASDQAAGHGLLLAASLDDAALLHTASGRLLVPGSAEPTDNRRRLLSLDRRPLIEISGLREPAAVAACLEELGHRGPVVLAGAMAEAGALGQALRAQGLALFALEDDNLWAPGAAFLTRLGRHPPVPRLPLVRITSDDCDRPATTS